MVMAGTKPNDSLPLGERLRKLREKRGWSLREVATRAGINHGYLSQLERGEVAQPAPAMLHKLALGYGEPFLILMRWAGYIEADTSGLTANQRRALSYLGDDVSEEELAAIKAVLDLIRGKRATCAQYAESLDGNLSKSDREEIRNHVSRLLQRSDAIGVVPTPFEQVMEVAQLVAADEITLEADERRQLRRRFGALVDRVMRRLQGVIHFGPRQIWVRPDLHERRKRFVVAHEIGHDVLPWQRDTIAYLDDEERLRPDVRWQFERQANQAAIELLAQGDALRNEADDSHLTLQLLWDLSDKYQISMQATSRRVVEESRQEAALAVRFRGASGYLGPWHLYCSASFIQSFGWHIGGMPIDAVEAARRAVKEYRTSLRTPTLGGSFAYLDVEGEDTGRALLVLFIRDGGEHTFRNLLAIS